MEKKTTINEYVSPIVSKDAGFLRLSYVSPFFGGVGISIKICRDLTVSDPSRRIYCPFAWIICHRSAQPSKSLAHVSFCYNSSAPAESLKLDSVAETAVI